jgi:hypothetical protein
MSIKPSSASEIRTLTAALASGDEVTRETAVARLAIFGPRAMDRVMATYVAADRNTRRAILRVLEAIADPRALPLARRALAEGGDVSVSAIATLRALLDSPQTSAATEAFDALVEVAMNRTAERRARLAALDALRDMPEDVRGRVGEALRSDPDPQIQAGLSHAPHDAAVADAVWRDAIDGDLGEDPSQLRDALATRGASAALGVLQKMIDAVRLREGALPSPGEREAWRALRGALHQALALRGSNVAIYDLRETFDSATGPLPATFLTAVHVVGDSSCLASLATAYAAHTDERWRQQLSAAFGAIEARHKITGRSAVLKRIASRWPEAAAALSTTLRTRPRPRTPART